MYRSTATRIKEAGPTRAVWQAERRGHLCEDLVNASLQSLLTVDLQQQCLLSQSLKLLRSKFVEDALELAIQLSSLFLIL